MKTFPVKKASRSSPATMLNGSSVWESVRLFKFLLSPSRELIAKHNLRFHLIIGFESIRLPRNYPLSLHSTPFLSKRRE